MSFSPRDLFQIFAFQLVGRKGLICALGHNVAYQCPAKEDLKLDRQVRGF